MDASSNTRVSLLAVLVATPGCGALDAGLENFASDAADEVGFDSETGGSEGEDESGQDDAGTTSDGGGTEESDTADTFGGTDTNDLAPCLLDCGKGTCIDIDGEEYCECPEGTEWMAAGCEPCPVVDPVAHVLTLPMVSFSGRFLLGGATPPELEYDDANLWLENQHTHDRVLLGNTHDLVFAVRVTPGIYDIVYELETPGALLPRNSRVPLSKVALFEEQTQDIDIPVATLSGPILLDGAAPPVTEYDDAQILFRDPVLGDEVLAGNTHDGSYSITLVPGTYEVVYRVQTPGPLTPRNDGALLMAVPMDGARAQPIEITSVPLSGDFSIAAAPPPVSEYDDANVELVSPSGGTVLLGNTHGGNYTLRVIPGSYDVVYRHETGANVPQNQRALFDTLEANGSVVDIDIPMVEIAGALTINGVAPPVSEFDDGVLHLEGTGANVDDSVRLGNTHAGSYQVKLIPGSYAVYYEQETSGGVVPDNKHAGVLMSLDAMAPASDLNIDVAAVPIAGTFTLDSATPPASEYDNGLIYLRNALTGDAVLLGSTHEGGYSAIVVPGDYEIFYEQDTGGVLLPSNLNASLGNVTVAGPTNLDLDLPVVALAGQVMLADGPAPMSASDGGQLYLRTLDGDSVLLGESFAPSYAVKLVAGTYGVYYRSEASVTTPQNENGRFACITVE